jgi:hypothetical protein
MEYPTLPKHFNLRFIMEGDRPLLQVDLYLPWESLLKVAQAIRWAARVQPTQESRHDS